MLSAGAAKLPRGEHAQCPPHAALRQVDEWRGERRNVRTNKKRKQTRQVSERKSGEQEYGRYSAAKLVERSPVPGNGSHAHGLDECGLVA
jgi:hypothetical protein